MIIIGIKLEESTKDFNPEINIQIIVTIIGGCKVTLSMISHWLKLKGGCIFLNLIKNGISHPIKAIINGNVSLIKIKLKRSHEKLEINAKQ